MGRKREKKPNTWDPKRTKKSKTEGGEESTAGDNKIDSTKYWNDIVPRNEFFEAYYKTLGICKDDAEWENFMGTLAKPLPTTFRINTTIGKSLQSVVVDQLNEIANDKSGTIEIDGEMVELPKPLKWYPNNMAWISDIPKKSFRKNPALTKFHNFLIHHNQQGNITRQEAVSMIPPLFLDVQSHHRILDMCAAPGSKTTQILEDLHMKHNIEVNLDVEKPSAYIPKGSIIANDVDTNRCYMLAHQTSRLGSPAIIITNHEAQNFPLLYDSNNEPMYLDRILCDVPCSGDGTSRKNPEVWKKWNFSGGIGLHTLQLRIATRGCHLLKVGGRIVYSTCSMNPVENEAVIAALLKRSEGSMKLVDVSSQYPDLVRSPGIYTWPVTDKEGTYANWDELDELKKNKYFKTLWPSTEEEAKKMHLEYCMRVYPHQQNTGGFFIAVLEKVADFPNQLDTETKEQTPADEENKNNNNNNNNKGKFEKKIKERDRRNKFYEEPFQLLSEEMKTQLNVAKEFYGLTDEFPMNNLLSRSDNSQKVYWASDSVMEIIKNPENKRLKIINCALKVFQRHDGLGSMDCPYRISQDSILWLEPFITKRIVTMTHDDLAKIIKYTEPKFVDFPSAVREELVKLGPGCFSLKISGNLRETPSSGMTFSAWRGSTSMHLLVSKQEIQSYASIFGIEYVSPRANTNTNTTTTTTTTATTDAKTTESTDSSEKKDESA
ncbi:hypothetical protein DICPUDRAFT_30335 [Dictyostelium purpureum]|uniref:SAM-dependent MTase RsmB/NOP-type domain-containing protein n=1 Tax=Dictyostelium purpureum TaxID=5786 RepID=F0ZF65_DICPU|nr:uncharacterized protein DICPUDRAFT_30335 [Dictyostelium purpureum]EGC37420.1 hypothetical protein DICPUDRAFT_30335 [Dictyostelium purpureum]|eukprot:XP_003286073.1 hypothetical protein DICPUDRAFT_30335 [Dictyostelium purpureum]